MCECLRLRMPPLTRAPIETSEIHAKCRRLIYVSELFICWLLWLTYAIGASVNLVSVRFVEEIKRTNDASLNLFILESSQSTNEQNHFSSFNARANWNRISNSMKFETHFEFGSGMGVWVLDKCYSAWRCQAVEFSIVVSLIGRRFFAFEILIWLNHFTTRSW